MPSKPRLTPSGLLAEPYGRRPHTVTLREEKEPGSNVLLDYTTPGGQRPKPSLGYPVRSVSGKRSTWDWDALQRARDAAEDRAAELRLGQLEQEVRDDMLTVGQAFALYHDPDRGGVRGAKSTIYSHRNARDKWIQWLGADTPWNSVTEADVEALLEKYRRRGMVPTAVNLLQKLRACYNWLRKKRKMKHLEDPTESIEIRDVGAGHQRRRPRYSPEEARRIIAVRDRVDPRFALMIALMDDSGARREALRRTMRSAIDKPLDIEPTPDEAPHGWILLPSLKRQSPNLVFLTSFQRRELDRALTGYLAAFEEVYQEEGVDYPLFTSIRLDTFDGQVRLTGKRDKDGVWRPAQKNAYRIVSKQRTGTWLLEAERLAEVEHVERRGYHGLRRAVADYLEEETDLGTLTTALDWSSQEIPERIYLEKSKLKKRARAREALERKRNERDKP